MSEMVQKNPIIVIFGGAFFNTIKVKKGFRLIRKQKKNSSSEMAASEYGVSIGECFPALIQLFEECDYLTNLLRVLFYISFAQVLIHKHVQSAKI